MTTTLIWIYFRSTLFEEINQIFEILKLENL